MKALIPVLFLALVIGFTLSSRSCGQHEDHLGVELGTDAEQALADTTHGPQVTVSVKHLDVILEGTVPDGKRDLIADGVARRLRAGRVLNRLQEAAAPAIGRQVQ